MLLITYDNHERLEQMVVELPLKDLFSLDRYSIPFLTSNYMILLDVPSKTETNIKIQINNRIYTEYTWDQNLNRVYFQLPQKQVLSIVRGTTNIDLLLDNNIPVQADDVNLTKTIKVYTDSTEYKENIDFVIKYNALEQLQVQWLSGGQQPNMGTMYYVDIYYYPFKLGSNTVTGFYANTILQQVKVECKNILALLLWISGISDYILSQGIAPIDWCSLQTLPSNLVKQKYDSLLSQYFYLSNELYKKILTHLFTGLTDSGKLKGLKTVLDGFTESYRLFFLRENPKWVLKPVGYRNLELSQTDSYYQSVPGHPGIYKDTHPTRTHYLLKKDSFVLQQNMFWAQILAYQTKIAGLLIKWDNYKLYWKVSFIKQGNVFKSNIFLIIPRYVYNNVVYPILYQNKTAVLKEELSNIATQLVYKDGQPEVPFSINDYIQIDNEILQVTDILSSDTLEVSRGMKGTVPSFHSINTKIISAPIDMTITRDGTVTILENIPDGTNLILETFFVPMDIIKHCLDLVTQQHVKIYHEFYDAEQNLIVF